MGHNDSSLVSPIPTFCYLIEKQLTYFFNYFKSILNTWKLSSNILKQGLGECAQDSTTTVTELYFQNLAATQDLLTIFKASL